MSSDEQINAVLMLAHGVPERVEDVEEYLAFVRGGRPGNAKVVEEVKQRYGAIGGSSPLLRWTREQAKALERTMGMPVFFAMRNWRPFIRVVVPQIQAERLRPLLPRRVLFTAHSLPEKALAGGDPYADECRATAGAIAARVGLDSYNFAFQSQGTTGDRRLGPTVESLLDRYAAEGIREVVIDPIGFVCDHVEVLYDIDIHLRAYAAEQGITVLRPESLNDSSTFTAALAEVAKQCLA